MSTSFDLQYVWAGPEFRNRHPIFGIFYKIQIRFQLIFGFKYLACSETWEFIYVINFIFPFGYKCTFKRIYAFQFELVLCKLVVKGHVVFWGQLTHTGDPGSEGSGTSVIPLHPYSNAILLVTRKQESTEHSSQQFRLLILKGNIWNLTLCILIAHLIRLKSCSVAPRRDLNTLLLTWINFNPSMDK